MTVQRNVFLQKIYVKLLLLRKEDSTLFLNFHNSITRLYNYYTNDYNYSIENRTKDFNTVEEYCFLPNYGIYSYRNRVVISDIMYITDLVLNSWNNMEKKKKQQQL